MSGDTPYPIIRFQTDDQLYRLRVFYDGPGDCKVNAALDNPDFGFIGTDGNVEAFPLSVAGVIAASVALLPDGGSPTLKGTAEGMGGLLYATYPDAAAVTYKLNEEPVTVPADTAAGDLMVMCLLFLDLDQIWWQSRPYVPPGWDVVAFDICDTGFSNNGLAVGVYSRRFGPDVPTTFNPFEQDVDLSDPWNIEPPEWVHLEGNWLAQLRIYKNAVIGDHRTANIGPARRGDGSGLTPWPALGDPVDLTSQGGSQVQFFCTQQQNEYTLDLAPGGSGKLLSGRTVQPIGVYYRDAAVTQLIETSIGPFFRMASEDLAHGFQGGNMLMDPSPYPPQNVIGATTTLHIAVPCGTSEFHATATLEQVQEPLPHFIVTQVSGDTAISVEPGVGVLVLREIADIGPFEVGTPLRHDGECDRLGLCAGVTPWKFGPPGPITRPGVHWRLVAEGPRFADAFESQDQWYLGSIIPGPRMQIKNGALTSADKNQVRTLFNQDVGWYYYGEKYALKWLAPGQVGDGHKLRVKACGMEGDKEAIAGPGYGVRAQGGVWAIVVNMTDRQHGLAFFWGKEVGFGWITDLRKLAYQQWLSNNFVDPGSGQDFLPLLSAAQAEHQPYIPHQAGAPETDVSWVEVWRDGNIVHAAYYESDPEKGEAPTWASVHDVTGDPNYGPSVAGYWGVVAGVYIDPDLKSYSGDTWGFDELTLWQAT